MSGVAINERMKATRITTLVRLDIANAFITAIATHGQKFFNFDGSISYLERSADGKLFFIDSWNKRRIYVSYHGGPWHGFHNGGTLRALVQWLVEFIQTGRQLPAGFFGRHWAYGDDMKKVVMIGQELSFVGPYERDYDAEMKLPEGKSCADCAHVEHCVSVLGCTKPERTSCDFWPTRYQPIALLEAVA